ncbi:hypothetical protein FH609_010975 [Streptomyces sp. 3MP-14]|uniref:Glucose/Sorbosone dehydrogenase domain-containing protein n=1 Tax=Streptomyces mimosae TaxID=2586635 RepID=A0A5N5ZR47_9ACTN|nr:MULTISPECIES: PQQ-dependent sugar dehydrogenase [Streptomyces]KAB8158333.1 hypothetical protein FH607_029600 [Streptomyces mimosae]KAB8176868.1 hypothetical protein FH609_010975 [Streptomyces sp. 3MP-14]
MGERAARRRPLRHALLVAVAGATLLAGCAIGPASDRLAAADGTAPPAPEETGDEGRPGDGTEGPTDPATTPEPEHSAEPEGSADDPEVLAEGLADACCLAELPGTDDVLVGSRSGEITRVAADGGTTELGQLAVLAGNATGELLGLAVDPGYDEAGSTDNLLYAFYSGTDQRRVVRYTLNQRGDGELGTAPTTLVRDLPRGESANGGALAFGDDGLLYIATGAAGQPELATDPESEAGKILRVASDGTPAPGNLPADSRIYAMGYPDVRGLAWDQDRDGLWAVTVTDEGAVEVTLVPPGGVEDDGGDRVRLDWGAGDVAPAGLAYVAGSLWVPSAVGTPLWRLPLDGVELSGGSAQELSPDAFPTPAAALAGADGAALLVLGQDGTLTRYQVE